MSEDKQPTWMVGGKPGLVLAAVKQAQESVDSVGKRSDKKQTMTFQSADETILVATKAILGAGAMFSMELSAPLIEDVGPSGWHVSVTAMLKIIHPEDGTYTVHTASSTSLANKFGKYSGAANTGARKQVWLTALGITTGESDKLHEETEETPETVEFLMAEIEATQTRDQLREVCCTAEYKAVRGKWRSMLAQSGRAQEKRLIRLGERKGLGPSVHPDEFKAQK